MVGNFKVGDAVYSTFFGYGEITAIRAEVYSHPIIATFDNEMDDTQIIISFDPNGVYGLAPDADKDIHHCERKPEPLNNSKDFLFITIPICFSAGFIFNDLLDVAIKVWGN